MPRENTATLFSTAPPTSTCKDSVVVTCRVYGDGIGDFSHFMDVCRWLEQHHHDVTLIGMVVFRRDCGEKERRIMRTKVKTLRSPHIIICCESDFSLAFDCRYQLYRTLREAMAKTALLIEVSTKFEHLRILTRYLPKSAIIPSLLAFEHDRDSVVSSLPKFDLQPFGMGLGASKRGIKIKLCNAKPSANLIDTIHNELFKRALLRSQTVADFTQNTIIVMAYVNNTIILQRLLQLLSQNEKLKQKNIAVVMSTSKEEWLNDELRCVVHGDDFRSTAWTCHSKSSVRQVGTSEPQRRIHLISGFWLSPSDYATLNALADFKCATGDNTFEESVNFKTLPFYFPRYYGNKRATTEGLLQIIQQIASLPSEVKAEFQRFLQPSNSFFQWGNIKFARHWENLQSADLPLLAAHWPTVCKYLARHHNFYTALERKLTCVLGPVAPSSSCEL